MDKELLRVVCRYHVLEIMLEAAVVKSIGASTGSDILMIKRFKISWSSVDHSNFQADLMSQFMKKRSKVHQMSLNFPKINLRSASLEITMKNF
ncbi:hypothetical protein AVEN_100537-1 [Araneus ventricosus]|uniref:Uncharacterized protein n=1 Tax=Araneus ventricosus TaxID=182803 RepID=A0A4Y2IT69_ARAVE|nr:hypothetical protein AVEN_100537-1 [Araneus ventricosus]